MRLDARQQLAGLVGKQIWTVTGRPNTVLSVIGPKVIVATAKSPRGNPIPVAAVQTAMDTLAAEGQVTVDVPSLGYRSAFIGAVLATVPNTAVLPTSPPTIVLRGAPPASSRLDEVRKLIDEHLTAAMIMVRLDAPLDPAARCRMSLRTSTRTSSTLRCLRATTFVSSIGPRSLGLLTIAAQRPSRDTAPSPRVDRLVEQTLELGEVAKRLRAADIPLLVVGRRGPDHIVTRADFTRPPVRRRDLLCSQRLTRRSTRFWSPTTPRFGRRWRPKGRRRSKAG